MKSLFKRNQPNTVLEVDVEIEKELITLLKIDI
jgi:hypothetical protein